MSLRITMSLVLAATIGVVGACSPDRTEAESSQAQVQTEPAHQSQAPGGPTAAGTVVETINAGNYTYVRVDTGSEEIWAAATRFEVSEGDTVVVPLEMPMQDFHSESMDRTFPLIYFTSQILREGETATPSMPAGHPPVAGETVSAHDSSGQASEPVEPADGGVTVEQVWTETAKHTDTSITVRGRVVKFNGGILGTNWIHLQDGTGSATDGTHDLTVTSLGTASVGDVITATGTLVTDQDFGAGYTYAVLLKDAEVVTD